MAADSFVSSRRFIYFRRGREDYWPTRHEQNGQTRVWLFVIWRFRFELGWFPQ